VGLIARLVDSVDRFFFAPRAIHALVLARVVFGLSLFLCYLNRLPDAADLYGPSGLLGPALATPLDMADLYGDAPVFQAWTGLLRSLPPPSTAAVFAMLAALMGSALAFALGLFTRASGCIALFLHHFFVVMLDPYSYWGWSMHIQPLMAYVILSQAGRYGSLDARRHAKRTGLPLPELRDWVGPGWPLRLVQIHTCSMYAVAGWARIDDSGWLQGQAVYDALTVALHAKFAINWQPLKPVLVLATWSAFALEGLAPLLLWVPRVGTLWAYLLIAMHAALELTANLGWWSHVMIASLLCFLPASHLEALLAWAMRWRRA
jgi:hypothetical protein